MFLLNLGYKWTFANLDGLHGAVLLACGNPSARLVRDHPGGEFQTLLFDPQLYLSGLRVEGRVKVCARLASYPWFQLKGVPEFDSSVSKRGDWLSQVKDLVAREWTGQPPADPSDAARRAIEFQVSMGCTAVVLPSPLLEEREDEAETLGAWLDAALTVADELEIAQPQLATVAVSEAALNSSAFEPGGLLEAIVDQVSARSGLDGVYIVVAQTRAAFHPFETSKEVIRAYWQLVHQFSGIPAMRQIVTNYADLGGFVALGLGATAFASGQSSSLRCLNIEAFLDEGGGKAMPQFYSHKTATEYLTERHLDRIVAAKLVRRIEDETEASAALIAKLRAGGSAAELPHWAESQNNLGAAQQHYLQRLVAEGGRFRKTRPADRLDAVVEWLESAEGNSLVVQTRLRLAEEAREKDKEKIGRGAPLSQWRATFSEVTGI